jgi:hypothetical protein
MDEKTREQIALFRYGLIAPIISGQVASQKDYFGSGCWGSASSSLLWP